MTDSEVTTSPTELAESLRATNLSGVMPDPSSIPVIKVQSFLIDDQLTEVFLQVFADRLLIGISQLPDGRIGHYCICEPIPSAINPKSVDYPVTSLLGTSTVESAVYARRLAERLKRTVVLGISMKQTKNAEIFHAIVDLVVTMYQSA